MSESSTINRALSSGFDRAMTVSCVMAVIFYIGFWLMLLCAGLLLTIPTQFSVRTVR